MKGMYRRLVAIGGGSGLLSCTCVVVPLVLLSLSASLAASVMGILGSFDLFFIIFGTAVFVAMLIFELKRKKFFHLEGFKALKGPISISFGIFFIMTIILIYGVAPALMRALQ